MKQTMQIIIKSKFHKSVSFQNIFEKSNKYLKESKFLQYDHNSIKSMAHKIFPASFSNLAKTEKDENIVVTIPNFLCVYRIGLAPIISYQLISENYSLALGLMATAALSDLIDGFIARNFKNQKSLLGSYLDPIADKILVFSLSVSLWHQNLLPSCLMGIFVCRDIILTIGASYFRYKTLEKRTTVFDIFNPKLKSGKIEPFTISKINTFLQFLLICTSMGIPVWGYGDASWLLGLQIICGASTIGSGYAYVSSKQLKDLIKQ